MKKLIVIVALCVVSMTGCQSLFDNTTMEERLAYAQMGFEAAEQAYQYWVEYRDWEAEMDAQEYQRELEERRERMERFAAILDRLLEASDTPNTSGE